MPSEETPIMAERRDASFYESTRFAETRKQPSYIPVYHLIAADGHSPRCFKGSALLYTDDAIPAVEVAPDARCRRAACKGAWPDAH